MSEERERADWEKLSAILAQQANLNRDPKKGKVAPDELNPFEIMDKQEEARERGESGEGAKKDYPVLKDLSILKQIFVDKKPPKLIFRSNEK